MSAPKALLPLSLVYLAAACRPDCPEGVTNRHGYQCTPVPGETTSDETTTTSDESTSTSSDDTTSTADDTSSDDTSSSTGTPPPCDDDPACGPGEDVTNCPEQCNVCGDSVVVAPETCDNGTNNDDPYSPTPPSPDACTSTCQSVEFCGDSIQNGPEPCDPGDTQTADCELDCRIPSCGDGTLNPLANESCDDGNTDPGDGCSPTCIQERRVFASSALFLGDLSSETPFDNPDDLSGILLADARCNALATAAGLPPTFKAWLSDSVISPSTRFDISFTGLYILPAPSFPVIATGWSDLTDGTLAHPINTNETGTPVLGNVFTNTNPDGTSTPGNHCEAWNKIEDDDNNDILTTVGKSSASEAAWTVGLMNQACSGQNRIYCFEDP